MEDSDASFSRSTQTASTSVNRVLAQAASIIRKNPRFTFFATAICLMPRILFDSTAACFCYYYYHLTLESFRSNIIEDFMVLNALQGTAADSPLSRMLLSHVNNDFRALAVFLAIGALLACASSVLEWNIIIHAVHAMLIGKKPTPKYLMSMVGKTWKGTLITVSLTALLLSVCIGAILSTLAFLMLALNNHPLLLSSSFAALSVPATASMVYVSMVCNLALVISVVQDGCYGFASLEKAMEYLEMRKVQGLVLSLVLLIVALAASIPTGFVIATAMSKDYGMAWMLALDFVAASLKAFSVVFSMAAYTVFYKDCDMYHHGGKEIVHGYDS